jgi:trigger factor
VASRWSNCPSILRIFETQAKRRRVSLGLIMSELVKAHSLAPKAEQVKALVEEYAQTYEQPAEVVRWIYSEPQRLAEFEGLAIEANVVGVGRSVRSRSRTRQLASMN